LKLFSVGNTELHGAYDTDDDVNLFLYSGEVFPERGYPQSTAVNGSFNISLIEDFTNHFFLNAMKDILPYDKKYRC
jgi:hypothetical protein